MIICSRKSGISGDITSGEIFGRLLVVLLLETRSLYIPVAAVLYAPPGTPSNTTVI